MYSRMFCVLMLMLPAVPVLGVAVARPDGVDVG